jgi:hypothetical protein
MFGVFSTKRKRATNAQIQKSNAKSRTPLLAKNTWRSLNDFLLPQSETKLNEIHKSLRQFPSKFKNISKAIKGRLGKKKMNWLFFEHFDTQKIFAQNVDKRTKLEETALYCAARANEVEIAKAVIEAGVDINAKKHCNSWTALHCAALNGHLNIGKLLIESGADTKIESRHKHSALQLAEIFRNGEFTELAKILRKAMRN